MFAFRDSEKKYARLVLFAGITVLVDQVTKEIIMHALLLHENVEVIPGFFALTYIRNTGGAFGLLAGEATPLRTLFFLAVSVVALVILFSFYAKVSPGKPWIAAAFAMIFGGALGNLIDRLRFGEVVDFLVHIFLNSAERNNITAPTEIALSATLNAGQCTVPR